MAEREQRKLRAGDKFLEELDTVVSFLDLHWAAQTQKAVRPWSWRKTIVFVLAAGLIGWSAILGLGYWIYTLL